MSLFQLQESSQAHLQPTLADTFIALVFPDEYVVNLFPDISGDPVYTDITFQSCSCRYRSFYLYSNKFSDCELFLPAAYSVKPVTGYSPEFSTYYAVVPAS